MRHKRDDNDIKIGQIQDRDETVLLLATQEKNIDAKITRLEKNTDDSERRSISDTSTRQ